MSSIYDWSIVAANNATSDSAINWAEGQAPSTVNNSARQLEARVAEILADLGGALTAGGTANALTVTANSAFTAYQNGLILSLRIATDNTAAATLNVNGIGAKSIRKMLSSGESALTGAELQATGICLLEYSTALNAAAGGWLLLNPATILASATAPGVVELATDAEAIAKADTTRAVTPGNLAALGSSATFAGLVELATDAEAIAKADTTRAVTPGNLAALGSTSTFAGLVELATDAEAQTGTDTARAITPANLTARSATTTRTGIAELATLAEVVTGTDTARVPSVSVMGGMAKAWVIFNGSGTVAIANSFNVSSVTDNGLGDYTINFTNALASTSYGVVGSAYKASSNAFMYVVQENQVAATKTVSALRIVTVEHGNSGGWVPAAADADLVMAIIFGG